MPPLANVFQPLSPATSFFPVWADVEAAMELDLLGVAVRAAWKQRSSTIKRFQPCEVTSWATARLAG